MSLMIVERLANKGALVGQVCEGRGVTFKDDRGGDAWKTVGEADVPCIGIHGDLEGFREGDLEMLLDSDLVRKRVIGGCAVGK